MVAMNARINNVPGSTAIEDLNSIRSWQMITFDSFRRYSVIIYMVGRYPINRSRPTRRFTRRVASSSSIGVK